MVAVCKLGNVTSFFYGKVMWQLLHVWDSYWYMYKYWLDLHLQSIVYYGILIKLTIELSVFKDFLKYIWN